MFKKKLVSNFFYENKIKIIIYAILTLIIFSAETVGISQMLGLLFDAIRQKHIYYNSFFKNITNFTVFGLILLLIIMWFVIIGCYALKNTVESEIIPSYLSYVRRVLFSHMINYYNEDYKDIKISEHATRIFELSRHMRDVLHSVLNDVIPTILVSVIIAGYYFYNDLTLGIICASCLILICCLIIYFSKNAVKLAEERERKFLIISDKIQDSFDNLMNVYLNNANDTEIEKNKKLESSYETSYISQMKQSRNIVYTLGFISLITFTSLLGYSYYIFKNKKISSSSFVSLCVVSSFLLTHLIKLSGKIPFYFNTLGTIKCSYPFLTDILSHEKISNGEINNIFNGDIVIKNLTFSYSEGTKNIFDNMSLTIKGKQSTAIFGKSGMGKTTLMKILMKMYKIKNNTVYIGNTDLNKIDVTYLRNNVNYVNQRTVLFDDTIMANIQYGNNATEKDVVKLLNKYDLMSVYSKITLENKYGIYSRAGVYGSNLSQGMQKVTILARGILKGGQIIIFDEPLSSLDKITSKKIMNMIKNETKNTTTIIISHSDDVLKFVDNVIVI